MTTATPGVLQPQTAQGLPVQGSRALLTLCAGGGLLCLALYTLVVLHVDIPHLPGSGMLIPQSVLAWMLAAALMLLAACASRQSLAAALRPSPFLLLSLAGVVILTLPLLYAPKTWRYLAELRVAGLWGGLLLMVAARALFTTPSLRRAVLVLMLAGCLLEAMTGIAQSLYPQSLPVWLMAPGSGRATGVFRQSNVLASFIGTGVLLTGCLLGRTTRRSAQGLILAATAVLAVCLPLTQSTQMWLTLAVVVVLACLPFMRIPGQRGLMRLWWCVLAAGVLAGFLFWHGLHGDLVNHAPGRYGRLQMWQNCLWLIAHRPWLGWGYGHFDMAYVHAWQSDGNMPKIDLVYTSHPHNEVLYWLTEGGLVAGAGLLLVLAAGVSLFVQAIRLVQQGRTRVIELYSVPGGAGLVTWRPAVSPVVGTEALAIACCTLPILMHMQLEWPLYLSSWHYLTLVMLLAMADGALQQAKADIHARTHPESARTATARRLIPTLPARALLLCAGAATLWWMVTGLMVGLQLTLAAQPGGLTMPRLQALEAARAYNPWVLKEEVWRTEAVAQANRAYQTGDLSLLLPVIGFEEQYLLRHPDPDITANLVKHLRLTGQTEKARAVRAQGHALAPWDARFSADVLPPDDALPPRGKEHEPHAGMRAPQAQTTRNAL